VILFLGFAGGYWLRNPSPGSDVAGLTEEISELKEMMMFSLLENESVSDRLRAVSLTRELDGASDKVTAALFSALNNDPSVNVRLAALEALIPFVNTPNVREGLIRSIAFQDSPLVQVSLAELMAAIQERKSVNELRKLVESDKTPREVREKIQQSISVLI
jgi:HEAT repeats